MLIAIGLGTLSTPVFCQEQHPEKYDSHGHEQGEIEVGLSIGYAYLKEEKEKGKRTQFTPSCNEKIAG